MAARTFFLTLPEGASPPFARGDVRRVRFQVARVQIHAVRSGLVADRNGRLLVGVSATGDVAWAPGWQIAVGDVTSRRGEVERRAVELTHAGTRVVAEDAALEVPTADGTWFVQGGAQTLAPSREKRPRPPPQNFSGYTTFAVLRAR